MPRCWQSSPWLSLRLLIGSRREQAVGHLALDCSARAEDLRHGLECGHVRVIHAGGIDLVPQPRIGRGVLGVEVAGLAQHLGRLVGLLAAEARRRNHRPHQLHGGLRVLPGIGLMHDRGGEDGHRIGLGHLLPFLDDMAQHLELQVRDRSDRHGAQRGGIDVATLEKRHQLPLVAAHGRVVRRLEPEIPLQDGGHDGVGSAADRRDAELLALEVGDGLDRRAVLGDQRRLGDLGGEDDLDRRALDAEREGAARRRGKRDVNRLGEDRLGRSVHVGEADVFGDQPLLLHELAGLEHLSLIHI